MRVHVLTQRHLRAERGMHLHLGLQRVTDHAVRRTQNPGKVRLAQRAICSWHKSQYGRGVRAGVTTRSPSVNVMMRALQN